MVKEVGVIRGISLGWFQAVNTCISFMCLLGKIDLFVTARGRSPQRYHNTYSRSMARVYVDREVLLRREKLTNLDY